MGNLLVLARGAIRACCLWQLLLTAPGA
ncbi:hypothetical protein A2U01_0091838, partial [Trifolium medium]|nr:hypothetical protein [Trifolium medium]